MERFVVGTGRCGSTLLSRMLDCHPDGLVLSEFLGALDRLNFFNPGIVSSDELKRILCANNVFIDIVNARGKIDKTQLLDAFNPLEQSVPCLLVSAMPFLSDKPDELFAEVLAAVDRYPDQPLSAHYLQLFAWLQKRFGKSFWIERTGAALEYMPQLHRFFPKSNYVHIHRDGPETVISMMNHGYFSALISFFTKQATREELEQTEFGGMPITPDDPISQRMYAHPPSYEQFAAYWNYQLLLGYRTFARLDASQYLEIRYEDLLAEPNAVITRIAEFFELPESPGWIDKAAAVIDAKEITSAIGRLPEDDQAVLREACMPGQILTDRYQHPWVLPTMALMREFCDRRQ